MKGKEEEEGRKGGKEGTTNMADREEGGGRMGGMLKGREASSKRSVIERFSR